VEDIAAEPFFVETVLVQIKGSSAAATQPAAELLYVILLPAFDTGAAEKARTHQSGC
jgi:hypothetical protein